METRTLPNNMKTYTNVWNKIYSTEMLEIKYNKTDTGFILIHSIETPEGLDYWCDKTIYDEKLDYEDFKDIHNAVIKKNIELN